jgi:hypothetical protein
VRPNLLVLVLCALPVTACAQPFDIGRMHERARQIAQAQARILKAIPLPGPDSANEPRGLDLTTGGDIVVTYWAPLFVISVVTPPNQAPTAVLSEIQFPPRGAKRPDPHQLPIRDSWTNGAECKALTRALKALDRVVSGTQRAVLHPDGPNRRGRLVEFDGAGYSVRISGPYVVGGLTVSGNDISPVGQWSQGLRTALQSCWKPLT